MSHDLRGWPVDNSGADPGFVIVMSPESFLVTACKPTNTVYWKHLEDTVPSLRIRARAKGGAVALVLIRPGQESPRLSTITQHMLMVKCGKRFPTELPPPKPGRGLQRLR